MCSQALALPRGLALPCHREVILGLRQSWGFAHQTVCMCFAMAALGHTIPAPAPASRGISLNRQEGRKLTVSHADADSVPWSPTQISGYQGRGWASLVGNP